MVPNLQHDLADARRRMLLDDAARRHRLAAANADRARSKPGPAPRIVRLFVAAALAATIGGPAAMAMRSDPAPGRASVSPEPSELDDGPRPAGGDERGFG
jgi:hypothetical protein